MCVSLSEYGSSNRTHRRCTVTAHTRAAAAASRQENRATMRCVKANAAALFGPASAVAVGSLAPSMLSNLVVSLEAVSPGIGADIVRSQSGALRRVPGMHNNVFTEVREDSNPASSAINADKHAPMAVSKIQLASALCERGLIERGAIMDPLEAAAELDRIETRIDAIASNAIVPPPPGTTFDDLPPQAQQFYRRHSIDEVAALTTVAQRLSDKLFEDVTEQAQVAATPRQPDPVIAAVGGDLAHVLTAGKLLDNAGNGEPVQIAEGVLLGRDGNGAMSVLVDGLRLPVDADTRVNDLLARIPQVDFDHFTKVPAGGNSSGLNSVVQSMMVGKSPRALSMRLAAKRRIIERTFYGDTAMSYTVGADGRVQMLAGKAAAHTAARLASRPHSSRHRADEQAQTTRIEGFDVARNMRFARAARAQFLETIPKSLIAPRAEEVALKRYSGPVSTEDRAAVARTGFQIRNPSQTLDGDYPAVRTALSTVDWGATAAVSAVPPGKALSPEHMDVRAEGARMVTAANQVARHGRNPELVSAQSLVAEAKLNEAFALYKVARNRDHTVRVLTAAHPVPAVYRGREADLLTEVFASGATFSTKGFTVARSDGAVRGGRDRIRVRYLTSDGMPVAGGDVIESGATFRVVSREIAPDGTIEVRAVAEQVAARVQQQAAAAHN